jgi:hypothetical protein
MAKKRKEEVVRDLQENADYVILNNPLSTPKLVRKLSMKKEVAPSEIYTPKLFYDLISRLKPEHLDGVRKDQNVSLTIDIGEFLKSTDAGNSKSLYAHVVECVDMMQTTQVKWSDSQSDYGTTIINFYEHHKGSGKITVQIHSELVRKVLEVTYHEHFSFLKKHLLRLQNGQAIKLFPFFVSWKNRGFVDMNLETFKKKFGYNTEGYSRFQNLKKYVLDPALKEIDDKTELLVTYETVGDSLESKKPRVTGLRFFIKEKNKQKQLKAEITEGGLFDQIEPLGRANEDKIEPIVLDKTPLKTPLNDIPVDDTKEKLTMELLPIVVMQFGVNLKIFMDLIEKHPEKQIRQAVQVALQALKTGKVANIAGFFVEAVRAEYKDVKEQKKQIDNQKVLETKTKSDAVKKVAEAETQARNEYSQRESERKMAVINRLIEADSDLLYEALEQLKNGALGRNYDNQKTIEANLKSPMLAGVLMSHLEKLEPSIFD